MISTEPLFHARRVLRPGDVITAIDGTPVGDDGNCDLTCGFFVVLAFFMTLYRARRNDSLPKRRTHLLPVSLVVYLPIAHLVRVMWIACTGT